MNEDVGEVDEDAIADFIRARKEAEAEAEVEADAKSDNPSPAYVSVLEHYSGKLIDCFHSQYDLPPLPKDLPTKLEDALDMLFYRICRAMELSGGNPTIESAADELYEAFLVVMGGRDLDQVCALILAPYSASPSDFLRAAGLFTEDFDARRFAYYKAVLVAINDMQMLESNSKGTTKAKANLCKSTLADPEPDIVANFRSAHDLPARPPGKVELGHAGVTGQTFVQRQQNEIDEVKAAMASTKSCRMCVLLLKLLGLPCHPIWAPAICAETIASRLGISVLRALHLAEKLLDGIVRSWRTSNIAPTGLLANVRSPVIWSRA